MAQIDNVLVTSFIPWVSPVGLLDVTLDAGEVATSDEITFSGETLLAIGLSVEKPITFTSEATQAPAASPGEAPEDGLIVLVLRAVGPGAFEPVTTATRWARAALPDAAGTFAVALTLWQPLAPSYRLAVWNRLRPAGGPSSITLTLRYSLGI